MRLGTWLREQATRLPGAGRPPSPRLAETRLIVLDVDVTGIDPRKDYATGVAMLVIDHGEFSLDRLRYCPIAPPTGSPTQNAAWRDDYRALVDSIADSPVLTYNARFVKHMIKQAAQVHDLPLPYGVWIDIAAVLYGAFGNTGNEVEAMRRWQERIKTKAVQMHSATADVYVLAQTLQALLAYCEDVGITTLDDLRRAQNARVLLRA